MISSESDICFSGPLKPVLLSGRRLFHTPHPPPYMAGSTPTLTLLGTGQDGGVPQAGCACANCSAAFADWGRRRLPVAVGVRDAAGGMHLIEATRALPDQFRLWADSLGMEAPVLPDSVLLTHAHLGHVEGLGQFGREAMGCLGLPLVASDSVFEVLANRGALEPFGRGGDSNSSGSPVLVCPGVRFEFISVPHRDDASDTHAILVIGEKAKVLFLPDHDDWDETLTAVGYKSLRAWFASLDLTHAMIDATFWSADELPGRDMSEVPHPLVEDTLGRLGKRVDSDPEIHLIHLNHSNPLNDPSSPQRRAVEVAGWIVGQRGWTIEL